jgi:hypothetical protein
MKLLSIIRAFNLLANNPLFHLGAFIALLQMPAFETDSEDEEILDCTEIDKKMHSELWLCHLICFFLLMPG